MAGTAILTCVFITIVSVVIAEASNNTHITGISKTQCPRMFQERWNSIPMNRDSNVLSFISDYTEAKRMGLRCTESETGFWAPNITRMNQTRVRC